MSYLVLVLNGVVCALSSGLQDFMMGGVSAAVSKTAAGEYTGHLVIWPELVWWRGTRIGKHTQPKSATPLLETHQLKYYNCLAWTLLRSSHRAHQAPDPDSG